ncbi:MAG: leucine-rich repeat domain-containing protein [Bacteroidales bacterium]
MKKTLLSILGLLCFMVMQAQVAKTVNMTQAGTLDGLLTANEKNTITDLILTGPIDARDFKTMREQIYRLAVLDMEGANIEEYSGNNGTDKYTSSYPANEIPTYAFSFNYNFMKDLTTVKFPAGVTSIGNYAFSGCMELRDELKFPAGLTKIGECAFKDCFGLRGALKLPAGVTSIGSQAFQNCHGLKGELIIPDGVTSIGSSVFSGCNGFEGALKLPASLITIGECAFENCFGLKGELIIPDGVTSIGSQAFSRCTGLTNIRSYAQTPPVIAYNTFENTGIKIAFVPTGSKAAYKSANYWNSLMIIDEETHHTLHISTPGTLCETIESAGGDPNCVGNLTLTGELNRSDFEMMNKMPILHTLNMEGLSNVSIPAAAFYHNSTLSNVILPSGLTSIEDYAFYFCNLTGELKLPATLTSIGNYAFLYCYNVTKITCEAVTPPSLEADVFQGIDTKTCELHVPQGSVAEYQSAPQWNLFSNIIEMDNPTGIITPDKSIRTWRANGQLFVESTEEMMAAEVVDMSGRRVCSVSKTAYAYVLNMQKKGVYVVRIRTVNGEVKTMKVAM